MLYYLISLLIVILDQALKKYMTSILPLCELGSCDSIHILPIFKLTMLHNRGAAFSFLDDAGGWQRWFLIAVSAGASMFIAGWLTKVCRDQKLLSWSLCLILGGAVGNLVDRVVDGYVVDFLVFYYNSYYFPAFNVADAAITSGAALLILDMLINPQRGRNDV